MFFEASFGIFAIFDGIFALIIKPWFSWVFWICRVLWYSLISYTSEQDISNKLGQIFSQNSSTQNYDPEFKKFKKQKEKTKLNFKSKNLEEYNRPFSLDESDVGCFPNRRSAFLRFLMASLHSSLNHGFPGCFGLVEVFGIVSSANDITVSLNFKVGISHFLT
jgi:hypothetical protein